MVIDATYGFVSIGPVIWIELDLRKDANKYMRIVKRKYDEHYDALVLEEGRGPDIIEEWEKAKQSNGTYKFTIMLDASGVTTFEEAIERFNILAIFPLMKVVGTTTKLVLSSLPMFMRKYCMFYMFLDYE